MPHTSLLSFLRRLSLLLLFTFYLGSSASKAEAADFKEQSAIWFGAFFEAPIHPISSKLVFYLDSQFRLTDMGQDFYQGIFRPAVGYMLPYGFSIFVGYGFFANAQNDPTEGLQNEHRIWQQLNWKWKFDKVGIELYSRTRIEQRFLAENADLSWRVRQYSRVSWMPHPKVPLGLGFGSEMFFQLNQNSWSKQLGLFQHRTIAALLIQLHEQIRPEIGYMHQLFLGNRAFHVLFVRFFILLD
jgi:hypothetical protein